MGLGFFQLLYIVCMIAWFIYNVMDRVSIKTWVIFLAVLSLGVTAYYGLYVHLTR